MNLDQPISHFRTQLYQVADMVAELYTETEKQKVFSNPNSLKVKEIFNEPIPLTASSIEDLLHKIKEEVFINSTKHYSPHFYPWVTSCASQASILGDFLATALNVNATTWMNSAAASEVEKQVVQWIGEFIGYDSKASGVLVSGGSTANLTGLTLARKQMAVQDISQVGLKHTQQFTVYASEQTHFCIDKSIITLGIGKQYLRKIKTLHNYTIDLIQLEHQIKTDIAKGFKPMCVVGNAGTVNSGAIDPLESISSICKKYNLWFHIDAAYGGCAANLPDTRELFKGFEKADSVAVDLHKWLFVPFEAGCVLVKDKEHLRQTFKLVPEYQKFDYDAEEKVDFSEYSFQQSRNFKALKVWMNFKTYGQTKLKSAIKGSITVMNHLTKIVEESSDFELITHGLSIVCFRYIGNYKIESLQQINEINLKLVKLSEIDGRVFIRDTNLNGMIVLRACCTNFRREKKHVEYLIKILRDLAKKTK
ncbi:pyridoxal phosphate-dependent decarboxylase family protein [Aquimarina rubra]|uniref:Pyridoxal phosphate-dependent decarboxylase family protein n=1 Tax=Aquimarina rubra TaxID=1920033 RepID=A0ABW5LB97_9FLAO